MTSLAHIQNKLVNNDTHIRIQQNPAKKSPCYTETRLISPKILVPNGILLHKKPLNTSKWSSVQGWCISEV